MLSPEINQMYNILVSFLGNSKSPLDETLQLQFSCPHCQEREGSQEKYKYHLEVNLAKGFYNCWKCSSIDDSMHGSIFKLIEKYGNKNLLESYKNAIKSFRSSSLYKLHFSKDDFQEYNEDGVNQMSFPDGFIPFSQELHLQHPAFKYLQKRGLDWPLINDYHMGFTSNRGPRKSLLNRIVIPSFDRFNEINYWTARDFTCKPKRQRYFNPYVERKDIVFNEGKVQWNADITLVEGPFDHIVVPNSIPLLGKNLTNDFRLHKLLYDNAHANINLFLDGDAIETVKKLYNSLNNGRLKGKIKYIYVPVDDRNLDPSKIFELYGRQGIIQYLNTAQHF